MNIAQVLALCIFSFIMGQFFGIAIIAFFIGATRGPEEEQEVAELPDNVTPLRRE